MVRGSALIGLLATLAVGVAGCASKPGEIHYATGRKAAVSPDGLHRVDTWGGRAERVYVRPGADLHGYDKVMLAPVVMRFSLRSAQTLDSKTVRLVEKTFQETLLQELAKSQIYTVVNVSGPGVLIVKPQLVDVVVTAPRVPATPDEQIVIQSAGAVTLALELADSRTNAALVRAFDRREVGDSTGLAYVNREGANLARARIVFANWARRLRDWLDTVREIPPLPVAESPAEG